MGERKVLNKYYPADFDPEKIPRRKKPKNLQIRVRMMLPMTIQCNACGNYLYKGTKFNARKENVVGKTYLGIRIYRFYFKCSRCCAELTMITDPRNSDYTMESGATRNFEPWRATDEAVDAAKSKREAEEMGDAMKALENRTRDSKQEMDNLVSLDEMKSMRARQAGVSIVDMLEALNKIREEQRKMIMEDEAIILSVVFQNASDFVRRLDDDDDDDDDIEDHHFEEEDRQQQDRKRRKGESLEENNGDKKNGALQAVNSLVERIPDPGFALNLSRFWIYQPISKSSAVEAQLALKPKPVMLSVKSKASPSAAIGGKTKGEILTGTVNDSGHKTVTEEDGNGKDLEFLFLLREEALTLLLGRLESTVSGGCGDGTGVQEIPVKAGTELLLI